MGKLIGIGLIITLGWVGLEIHNEGLEGAFGGILSSEKEAQAAAEYIATPQRVGERARRALELGEERTKRLTEE